MRKTILNKTAGAVALLMVVSMLMPVLAFAGVGFKDVKYSNNGTVSGTVYADGVYGVLQGVYVDVFNPDGEKVTAIYATYDKEVDGVRYYNFSKSVGAYTYVNLLETITNTVYHKVNRAPADPGPGGGGGGWTIPSASDIITDSTGKVDASKLADALKGDGQAEVKLSGEVAIIPASALVEAAKIAGASLNFVTDFASYQLPLSVLNLEALAKQLGADLAGLNIKVEIKKVTGDTAKSIGDAAKALGGTVLADAVDFKVSAEANGKTQEITDFGNTYVSRTITVNKSVDAKKVTGVLFDPATKKLSFVPSVFNTVDGKTTATLKRNGNSIYTVVEFNKSFADIASHWAKDDVELLANKLIVEGVSDTKFEADRNITRAEFAALVVRALGLNENAAESKFDDVKAGAWYTGVVGAAAKAGIVNGYEDGTFRPDAQITREELAAMVVRAMAYAGKKVELSASKQAELLAKFKDSDMIVWAQKELAIAIDAKIVDGMTNDTLGSAEQATRAQSATMLKRFLTNVGFIN